MTHDHGARRHSYELIAEAFGLRGQWPDEPHEQVTADHESAAQRT
jgi:hypothetical protein